MHRSHRRFIGFATLAAALMLITGMMSGAGARVAAHGDESHPAHLHVGTCDAPGEVVFPLSDVSGQNLMDGTPVAGEAMGADTAVPVDYSSTTVQAPLADIISGGHAVVVHESAENIGNYLACGAVGGMLLNGTDLFFGLSPLNDSGYSGIAYLTDNGDGTTEVEVFLTGPSEEEGGEATAGGDEVAASIKDFAFDPGTIEIAAGTTVTWTNNDSAPHTVSQVGGGFESGKIEPGATFSFTFDTPGEYEYFCQFHPNMKAKVVVS